MKINKEGVLLVCICMCSLAITAQEYNAKAKLSTVNKTGFYKIDFTPQMSSYVKTDLSDIRIVDEDGNQAKYIVRDFETKFSEREFILMPILSNKTDTSKNTILIIENTEGKMMGNDALLFLKNNNVSRIAILSGSNDKNNWYIINNNSSLNNVEGKLDNFYINTVSLNNTDYKYYKIEINNNKEDPYNIIKVGHFKNSENYNDSDNYFQLIKNPTTTLIQKDSNNAYSYLELQNKNLYHIEKVKFYCSGQSFFKREASIFNSKEDLKNNTLIRNFIWNSTEENVFEIDCTNSNALFFRIKNMDNKPLHIDSIVTFQKKYEIVVYLDAEKKYDLLLQNNIAEKPEYDLQNFKDSIPQNLQTLTVDKINKETVAIKAPKPQNKYWVWIAIATAIVVLGYLTKGLLADMKKQNL